MRRMRFLAGAAMLSGMAILAGQATAPATGAARRPRLTIERYAAEPVSYFATDAGKQVAANVLSWQTPGGAWAKNNDDGEAHKPGTPYGPEWEGIETIDNGATHSELVILAKANAAAPSDTLRAAFVKGLDRLLMFQYDNGGFAQRFPPPDNYGRYITFNDDAMTDVMELLGQVKDGAEPYAFVDAAERAKAKAAYDKGVTCILKCVIRKDGKAVGWCAQHDDVTLKPANARAYELPSISGSEGAHVAIFLMKQPHPDAEMKQVIRDVAAWFDAHKVTGIRVRDVQTDGKHDRVVEADASAPPLWGRFYDLETEKPFFCGRDGIKRATLAEIEQERRGGYSWYGNWGAAVAQAYGAWQKGPGAE